MGRLGQGHGGQRILVAGRLVRGLLGLLLAAPRDEEGEDGEAQRYEDEALHAAIPGRRMVARAGVEPATPALSGRRRRNGDVGRTWAGRAHSPIWVTGSPIRP